MFQIDGKTKLYGLLGNPVGHSLSPMIHNEAFRRLSVNGRYLAFSVEKETLPGVLSAFRNLQIGGLNLTMPLKEAVLPLCDSLSPEAKLSASVNTLQFREESFGERVRTASDFFGH